MQRDYVLLEATVGLCPHCLARLDGKIIAREGQVFISRWCPQHGAQLDLIEEDLNYYLERNRYTKPATLCQTQTPSRNQCPFDCGLCPNHEQHTCIGLVEITNHCDLSCPVCYAASGEGSFLAPDVFERMLDFVIASEAGNLDILQLSGGEPTTHPELEKLIRLTRAKGVQYVLLNTNGLGLVQNPALVEMLATFKDRFEVYLQFDGVSDAAQEEFRGKPLVERKRQALAILSRHEIPTTLVASVGSGVNDAELGALIVEGLRTPFVRGVSFQTLAYFGRLPASQVERTRRATISGVLRRLETQMKQMIRSDHLVPLPCDVDGVALGYFRKGADGSFAPMITRADVLTDPGPVKNTLRFSPDDFVGAVAKAGCCGGVAGKIRGCFPQVFFKTPSGPDKARMVSETTFRVTITSFVDAYNFTLRSCQRECVHVITPDLRKIPFSAYNLYHRPRATSV